MSSLRKTVQKLLMHSTVDSWHSHLTLATATAGLSMSSIWLSRDALRTICLNMMLFLRRNLFSNMFYCAVLALKLLLHFDTVVRKNKIQVMTLTRGGLYASHIWPIGNFFVKLMIFPINFYRQVLFCSFCPAIWFYMDVEKNQIFSK